MPGAGVLEDAHGFGEVDVLGRHEPARRVGADGDQRHIGRAIPVADLAKDGVIAVAGIAGEQRSGWQLAATVRCDRVSWEIGRQRGPSAAWLSVLWEQLSCHLYCLLT